MKLGDKVHVDCPVFNGDGVVHAMYPDSIAVKVTGNIIVANPSEVTPIAPEPPPAAPVVAPEPTTPPALGAANVG